MNSGAYRALKKWRFKQKFFSWTECFGSKFTWAWKYVIRFCKIIAKTNVEVKNFVKIYYKMFIDLSVDSYFRVTEAKPTQIRRSRQHLLQCTQIAYPCAALPWTLHSNKMNILCLVFVADKTYMPRIPKRFLV